MALDIYAFPPSPRAFKVLFTANLLELPYTLHLIDFGKGDHRTPDFLALNPNGKMPVMKDGDCVLWESNAIIQYLAAKRPDSGLLPTDEAGRLDVTRWQFWDLAHWDAPCSVFIFENFVKGLFGLGEADSTAIERVQDRYHAAAKVLDGQLKGRRYITGDTLTVADISVGSLLNTNPMAKLPVEPYAEIRRWYAELAAMPVWQKTLADAMK